MEFLSARDQNELLVSPEGNVRPSDRLNYTINYEHEGEDNTSKVSDEYRTAEPSISGFGSIIQLEAWREGSDLDGRGYTISVITQDKADNRVISSTTVICPHD